MSKESMLKHLVGTHLLHVRDHGYEFKGVGNVTIEDGVVKVHIPAPVVRYKDSSWERDTKAYDASGATEIVYFNPCDEDEYEYIAFNYVGVSMYIYPINSQNFWDN